VADGGYSIIETPLAAGLAWYIAHTLLGHHQPFFAPTAAAVALSKNRVLRSQRALQLMVGVVLGIGIGSAVKAVAGLAPGGSGAVAIGVAVLIALVVTLALGGGFFEQGVLFVNQCANSAILMIAVTGTATATERLSDALVGGGVALAMTLILFPASPLPLIHQAARQVFAALRDVLARLAELAGSGRAAEPEWALAAGQRIQHQLAELQAACSTARQVAGIAPRRWPDRPGVRRASEQTAPLNLLAASVLSLAHASTARTGARPPYPPAWPEALNGLAAAFAVLAEGGDAAAAQAARHAIRVQALVTAAAQAPHPPPPLIARFVETCADVTLEFTSIARAGRGGAGPGR
jgi:uncharacterized membrane protein YgaE (UPF0421/DUF939 family)